MLKLSALIPMFALFVNFSAPSFAEAPPPTANSAAPDVAKPDMGHKDKTLIDSKKSKHPSAKAKGSKNHRADCKCEGKKCDDKECKAHTDCKHCKGKGCEHCKSHEHNEGEGSDGHGAHHHHEDHKHE